MGLFGSAPAFPSAWGLRQGVPSVDTAPEIMPDAEGHLTTVQPPQMIIVDATTALNATVTNTANGQSPPYGIIETITPMSLDGVAIPRGRIYAQLLVMDSLGNPMQCFWQGYMRTSGGMAAGPSSAPSVRVYPGWRLVVSVTQTGQGAPVRVGFHCHIRTDGSGAAQGGYVFSEPPGSGIGELKTVTVTTPAAGANASLAVPALERWAVLSSAAFLAVSGAAGTRTASFVAKRNGAAFTGSMTGWAAGTSFTTAGGRYFAWGQGLALATQAGLAYVTTPIPQSIVVASQSGDSVAFSVDGMDVADQLSALSVQVECWAVPA